MTSNPSKRTHAVYISSDEESNVQPAPARPSTKRACAEPDTGLWNIITSLPADKTNTILFHICANNPTLTNYVQDVYRLHLAEEAAKEAAKPPENFDTYSRSCWHALNTEHKRKRGSVQYEASFQVSNELDAARRSIMKKAGRGTRWETRRNALGVLRKISKSVMLCNLQVIRHEVMGDGILLGQFADSMLKLAKGMSELERRRYKDEGLWEKLFELQNECEDIDLMVASLPKVYAVFNGDQVSQEEEEEEDQDSEDGEDEDEEQTRKRETIS